MEEILELKKLMLKQDYPAALNLIEEMEEMSRDDKISRIKSHLKILMLHVIKQDAEKRSTRSWELSIDNAVDSIHDANRRRKAGGCYVTKAELAELIEEAYPYALKGAALEVFEGQFTHEQLADKIDTKAIKSRSLKLIIPGARKTAKPLK